MDGMGHGGFARGQTKDLRKGLKTKERAGKTHFVQTVARPLSNALFSNPSLSSLGASHVSHPVIFAWNLVSSFSRHRRRISS